MTISELLISYRKEHSLSQRRFAELCDLSNGYISMLENNQNPSTGKPVAPTLPALKKISQGMGISLDEFLARIDENTVISLRKEPVPSYSEFSPDERQLIEDYRSLTPPGQEYIRQTMAMAKMSYAEKNDALPNMEEAN